MTKHFYFVVAFAIQSFAISAQTISVGRPYPVIDAEIKNYYSQNGEILTIKVNKKGIVLQKMSAVTLTSLKMKTYEDFPKGYQIEKITEFKNRYYVFYSLYDDEQEKLFYREIDFASGSFMGAGKKLISVKGKLSGSYVKGGAFKLAIADKYDFYFSYDSTALAVQYRVVPEKRNDEKSFDIIGMHVFKSDLSQIWSNSVTMPYTEKKMDNLDYSVDSKGNVYVVARVFDDNTTDLKKKGEDDANYHLEILKVAASSTKITSTKVDVVDKFVKTMWLYESSQGYMVCAGFYNKGNKGRGSNTDGIILFKLSPEGKLFDMNSHEIPVSILNQYASDKAKRKNERKEGDDEAEFENLSLIDVVIQEDGSLVLVGEQRLMKEHRTSTSATGSGTWYYTYHSNDILITKIDPSGKLAWMKKLPKRQMSSISFGTMAFRYFVGSEHHYFMFLDNEKNKDLPVTEVPALHIDGQGGFLTSYLVNDNTGEVSKLSILDTRDVNGVEVYQFSPSRLITTAPNTLVFEAYKKSKEDILVKIVLK